MAALTHSAESNCAETCLDIVSEAFVDVLTWLSDHAGAFLDSLAQVRRRGGTLVAQAQVGLENSPWPEAL